MSDDPIEPAFDPAPEPGLSDAAMQDAIDDILSNEAMTIEEKEERLRELAGEAPGDAVEEHGSEYEPVSAQIRDALAMLAGGGHLYGSRGKGTP